MGDIKGITFSNQAVTPKDDGQLRTHLLTDGRISGCGMAYSAATFSLAAGYLIAAGRLMSVPTTVYKAVDQATSGFARVLLTIDLTGTATKTEFEQAQLSVEYSSTQNGFASLVQGDINGKDTTYQVVLAVLALGSGGITSIVSTMGVAKPRNVATASTVSLSGWSGNTVTVSVPGVTADSNVIVTPHPDSFVMWSESMIRATAQGAGTLTFACEETPSGTVKANVLIVG